MPKYSNCNTENVQDRGDDTSTRRRSCRSFRAVGCNEYGITNSRGRKVLFGNENARYRISLCTLVSRPGEGAILFDSRLFGVTLVPFYVCHFWKGNAVVGCKRIILSIIVIPSGSAGVGHGLPM